MYARESFTIAEVADLLSIRRLSDSYQDEFPVECPFCGAVTLGVVPSA